MRQYEIIRMACIGILLTAVASNGQRLTTTNAPAAIPWSEIGAKAGTDYRGDGLAVTQTESGARLHCVFQRLDGEATSEGLWLTSTVSKTVSDRFRVTAMEVGRKAADATFNSPYPESSIQLEKAGEVSVCGQTVRFSRPGLTEEYSVSMDGLRQDFIVEDSPGRATLQRSHLQSQPAGELIVKLAVTGAQVEPAADSAQLVLDNSGRKIAYSRLRVTDATGKELPARIEVCQVGDEVTSLNCWDLFGSNVEQNGLLTSAPTSGTLAVVVNDEDAVYPVRIDPTFSDANWVSMGGSPSVKGFVFAAVTDGSSNLYVGGGFREVGTTDANYVAQWNGSSWSALGAGIGGSNPDVYALAVSGGTLYAGGIFTTAGGNAANKIAQWNGSNWSSLGSGIIGNDEYTVYALAVSGGTLYAGGYFTNAGGSAANDVAQWNGSSWSALGSGIGGIDYVTVSALAVSGSTLYAGGDFTTAGGSAANSIAQWNGSSWSALGSGLSGLGEDGSGPYVAALAVSGSTLYAGGDFTTAGGSAANYIAQWNGSSWSALGSGMNGDVVALAASGSTLYAVGDFTTAGSSAANYIAQWNGSSWSALGSGISGGDFDGLFVNALAVSGGTLYVDGNFTTGPGSVASFMAKWNGNSWSGVGSGLNGQVYGLAVSGGTLYAGGDFTMAGISGANSVAQWNGSSWSALGSGMSGVGEDGAGPYVQALAVSGGMLYAGGDFTMAGGSVANYIAQWNGSSWSALGSGMSGVGEDEGGPYVDALAVSGGMLYAGGDFTTAGGSAANYIAQWNGSGWSALGPGISGLGEDGYGPGVYALAVSGGTLYAGGDFAMAGGSAASCIAQWNGGSWSALGSGLSGEAEDGSLDVSALAVSGSTLYAGGNFTTAGGSATANIAQWNGSSWSALGAGISGGDYDDSVEFGPYVGALAVSGSTLYAGGLFTTAGGSAANDIAQWNGSSWSALGSGISSGVLGEVNALAVTGSTLYAGGNFTTAGTNVSAYMALANLAGTPVSIAIIATNAAFGFTNGVFGFDVACPSGSNLVIQVSTDLHTWIPLQTNLLGSSLLYFSDAQSPANRQRFYRVELLSP